jgi:hypothetical protein
MIEYYITAILTMNDEVQRFIREVEACQRSGTVVTATMSTSFDTLGASLNP